LSIHVTPIPSTVELAAPSFTLGSSNVAGSAATAVASDSQILIWAVPGLNFGTSNIVGSAATGIRSDATLLAFDTTIGSTYGIRGAAITGSAVVASRRDHTHGTGNNYVISRLFGH